MELVTLRRNDCREVTFRCIKYFLNLSRLQTGQRSLAQEGTGRFTGKVIIPAT
jgi:hypothetical protein